ncbi:MAG TPA: putative toxin-antitoxin system toxin component, PIN family [Candidatus Solibacter sp.]|nr:putative toxin-antitoxin system toxin component, PIN family [Candidatus Solibacter sp.]
MKLAKAAIESSRLESRIVRQIVIDTNALVAGLRSKREASYQILRLIGDARRRPNVSVALALEYEDVLKRENMLPGVSAADVDTFLDYILAASNLVGDVMRRRPTLRDPDDERILELAVRCDAMIITHNLSDFSGAQEFGVVVCAPSAFLQLLREDQ